MTFNQDTVRLMRVFKELTQKELGSRVSASTATISQIEKGRAPSETLEPALAIVLGVKPEFFADKISWIDSAWDMIHTLVRPVGGALLALAIVDAGNPVWQIVILLLGGGATLLTHGAKAGTRALVNTSPEPVSNVVVSGGEDVVTGGALIATLASPVAAGFIAIILLAGAIIVLVMLRRLFRSGPGRATP